MGDVKPLLWGKNPCFITLWFCHLCCLSPLPHPTLSTSLMLQLVVGEVIAEVVVVVAGCQPYPLAHSTHIFHSSPSRTLPWSVHSTTILVVSPHAQVFGAFLVSRRFFFLSPRVAEYPRTAKSRPSCCVCIHGQKRSCFSSRRASIVCYFPCWVGLFTHAQAFFCLACT